MQQRRACWRGLDSNKDSPLRDCHSWSFYPKRIKYANVEPQCAACRVPSPIPWGLGLQIAHSRRQSYTLVFNCMLGGTQSRLPSVRVVGDTAAHPNQVGVIFTLGDPGRTQSSPGCTTVLKPMLSTIWDADPIANTGMPSHTVLMISSAPKENNTSIRVAILGPSRNMPCIWALGPLRYLGPDNAFDSGLPKGLT